MTQACVGLESALGDSPGILREAFARIASLGERFENSDLYLFEPRDADGSIEQFIAAARFDTERSPEVVLKELLAIEAPFRRDGPPHAARDLNIDLLLFGGLVREYPALTLPHWRVRAAAAVLGPLADIAPEASVPPGGLTIAQLWRDSEHSKRDRMRRFPGTARLGPAARLDYDTPGGAGASYDTLRPFSAFDRVVFDAVVHAIGGVSRLRVLDVGCGTGRFTEKLAEAGARVVGYDASETMLESARARQRSASAAVEYVRGDANVSLPGHGYDAVTAFYCVQYFDVERWCRAVYEALAPDGALAIATFPHRHFAQTEFARFFPSLTAIDTARFPSVPRLERALADAGFADVSARFDTIALEDDPRALIERVERKFLSSFFLLPAEEFREGVARMRKAWLGRNVVHRTGRSVVVSGRRRGGSR